MHIEPQRLKFLLAVARTGGVLAAADEMHVTASAVSQQLTRLEREVGRQLVTRNSRGAVLTADGLALVQAAEEVERALNQVAFKLQEGDADPAGTVRIGAFHSFLRAILIPSLAEWRAKHPRLRIELVEGNADMLMRLLRSGELDIVIFEVDTGDAPQRLPAGMTETPLLDEPWKILLPKGVLADSMDLSAISLPWLGVDDSSASAQAMRRVGRAFATQRTFAHHYFETQTALALVAAGEGVAMIPSLALHGIALEANVDALAIPGLGMRRIVLRRYERKNRPETVDVAAQLIRDAAAAFEYEPESVLEGR